MKIDQYFKSLLPSFGKDTVLEDCRLIKGEIKDTVAPAYKQAVELMKNWNFKSADVQQLQKTFKSLAQHASGNIIVSIDKAIPIVLENLETVEDLIERCYNEEIAAGGVTYLKAQLLQYVEAASFFSAYSRALLNFIYVHESAPFIKDTDEQSDAVNAHLIPAEVQYVMANIQTFCVVFNALGGTTTDMKKKLAEIPDIVITSENAQTLPHTVGIKKLDPGAMGLIPTWINPIYHIRIGIAEWQFERYRLSQQELAILQMRKLNLEKIAGGQQNAALQLKIEEHERRIQGLKSNLAKMEKDYA